MAKKVVAITNTKPLAEKAAEDWRKKGYLVKIGRTDLGNYEVRLLALLKK